jgi:hypothetical protein
MLTSKNPLRRLRSALRILKSQIPNPKSPIRPRRPLFETLENRSLLAQLTFGTPFSLGSGVNTAESDYGPTVTADGLSLLFARTPGPGSASIFEATRATTDAPFGNPVNAGAGVNFGGTSAHPAVSQDGLTLIYNSGNAPAERLYQATRPSRSGPFGTAVSLGDLVGNQALESPSLSSDGLTLFFTVWDAAHATNDIYQATRNDVGDPWGNVVMLASDINVPGYNDAQPSISSDGLMLFFNSNRPGGFGGFDLYVASRPSLEAPWEPAVNLGSQVNTADDDKGPGISADGSLLYFAKGEMDLYAVTVGYDSPAAPTISISDATATEGSTAMKFVDDFVTSASGGLSGPRHLLFGPDTNDDGISDLYVPSRWTNEVLKYDGTTGALLGVLIDDSRLVGPWAMALGPDGNLYVGGADSNNVLRYNFATQTVDEFLPAGTPGLIQPKGLAFGADGDLYIACITPRTIADKDEILRFQGPLPSGSDPAPGSPLPAPGQTGAVFIPNGAGGASAVDFAKGLAFGQDVTGDGIPELYVSSGSGNSVNRYNGATGAFLSVFVASGSGGLANPDYLTFHDGSLYVASQDSEQVMRYLAATGAFVDVVVPTVGGEFATTGLAFDGDGNLYVAVGQSGADSRVVRYGAASQAAFTVSLSSPSALEVTVDYATAISSADAGDFEGTSGTIKITFAPGQTSRTNFVQTVNDTDIEPNQTFNVVLSAASGGVIADGTGVGTIIDDDTKFYVVNDGSTVATDKTFEYGTGGPPSTNAGESYTLASGNTTPRGAASTAAGDKVWVVDANKNVYVYGPSGNLLGSWSAGSIPGSLDIQGVTTNGTDVWIVDAKSDKVFKYAGAATRLSGSQNAAGSFSLNKSNTNPKDLVTDGTYLWVVNDSTTDKVFRYTIASPTVGIGSFSINTVNPTGITLEPGNPASPFWIVDNANDGVSQFARPANTATSGTLAGSVLFSLAASNTNPQGIADPPVRSVGGLTTAFGSSSSDSAVDSALLSIVFELDGLLSIGKKRK